MKNHYKSINRFPLSKLINYRLHLGGFKRDWNPHIKPYLYGFRNNFGIVDFSLIQLSIRQALKLFSKIVFSKKKILFIGSPFGLEKQFSLLCRKYRHYHLSHYSSGFFTNFIEHSSDHLLLNSLGDKPSLIVFFNISGHEKIKRDLLKLNLPMLAFATTGDDLTGIDYIVPANIHSWSGGLFVYNLLYYIFHLGKKK